LEAQVDYKDKNIVVTGGTGFLGQHLVERLRDEGAHALALPRKEYNLVDPDRAVMLMADAQHGHPSHEIDYVFHLAATVMGIGAIEDRAYESFYTNAMMGMNVIHAARHCGAKKFVYMGTVCSYPERCPVPMVEENFWWGKPEITNAPYGISKRAMLSMLESSGLDFAYIVAANLYGPGDNFDDDTSHVIPALIKKFHQAARSGTPTVEVWGSGKKSRDFLYVTDAADGLAYLGEKSYGLVNIGTGVEIPIFWLAESIALMTGFTGEIVFDPEKPSGQERRCLALRRAKDYGWPDRRLVDLADGLQLTYDWWCERENIRND
jgi:GDP-L-fucose synthase